MNDDIEYPLKNFEDVYSITKSGVVKNINTGHIMNFSEDKDGYLKTCLTYNEKEYCRRLHRMLAL